MVEQMTNIEAIAKKYYKEDGQNQWPHIQRVLEQANKLAAYRGRPLNETELAALYFHDVNKADSGDVDHGVYAAERTKQILKNKISERRLQRAANAIAEHNLDTPASTQLADLVRSADANKPDLDWYLRKSYSKMTKKGWSHERAIQNAYDRVKQHMHTLSNMENPPKLYTELFAKEIEQANKEADKLKFEDVYKRIQQYTEKHPEESLYA